jgi:hypothetical protein
MLKGQESYGLTPATLEYICMLCRWEADPGEPASSLPSSDEPPPPESDCVGEDVEAEAAAAELLLVMAEEEEEVVGK